MRPRAAFFCHLNVSFRGKCVILWRNSKFVQYVALILSCIIINNNHTTMKKFLFSLFAVAMMSTAVSAQDVTVDMSEVEPISPEYQEMVDQLVELNLTDPEKANKVMSKLLGKTKKDVNQSVAIGKFFVEQGLPYYGAARQFAQQSYQSDATNVSVLKLNAAVALMRKDYGAAGQKVDEILMQDENNIEAIRLSARVYKYVNPYVAIEQLEKILAIEPNNANAYKELGDIYYTQDEFKKACENYAKYFEATPAAELSILSAEQYCYSLIGTNEWETLAKVANVVEPLKDDDIVFKRARFYSDIETYKESSAHNSVKYITEKVYADSTYLYRDYAYAAEYAKNNDDLEGAVNFYKKGLEIDSTQLPAYQQIAGLYRRMKQIDNALEYYNIYLDKKGDKAELADQRGLLQIYIAAKNGAPTLEEKQAYAEKGDVIAQRICTEKPDSYQGPYYRAQLWILDPQNAEAKPYEYYQKVIELLQGKEDYSSQVIQAATYCAFCCLKNNEDAKCLEYCDMILALDAENAQALQFKKIIEM